MKKWLPNIMVALLAAVPTVLLVADYYVNHRINWILLIVWFVVVVLCIAFTMGDSTDEPE